MGKYIMLQDKIGRSTEQVGGVACDGYLMDHEREENKYRLLAVSLVGEKRQCQKVLGWMTCSGLIFDKGIVPERLPYDKSREGKDWMDITPTGWKTDFQHVMAWRAELVLPASLTAQTDAKIRQAIAPAVVSEFDNAEKTMLISADTEEARDRAIKAIKSIIGEPVSIKPSILGSKFSRMIAVGPEVQGKTTEGADTDRIYLIGSSMDQAKQQFFARLVQATIPVLPEWQDLLWDKFQSEGWVTPLVGHRMAGYVIAINRDGILDLIGSMIEDRKLPCPDGVPAGLW